MYPLNYIEPVFRPPSEWQSLILQVTNGCSWNKCSFCNMYTDSQKLFQPKPLEQIDQELSLIAASALPVHRVFLADGDAMTLSSRRLMAILRLINLHLPLARRISAYCLPRNLKNKSVTELKELRQLGLSLLYVGCESGDDELLRIISKGETYDSSLKALQKMKSANIKSSVMVLNGLGGRELSERHAQQSARLMNEVQPDYLSTLVVEFPYGNQRFKENFGGRWELLSKTELFHEMAVFIQNLTLESTVFRSDHESNNLMLKGVLGKDKLKLLDTVNLAIQRRGIIPLREERFA